jgi:hypothetical protein
MKSLHKYDIVKIHAGECEGQEGLVLEVISGQEAGLLDMVRVGVYREGKNTDITVPLYWVELIEDGGNGIMNEEKESPIKDSGERREFSSGAVRDMSAGKGLMIAMPWRALLRLSKHYENGARKYGIGNYMLGIPTSSFIDSAMRHLAKYMAGMDDEDHLSAAAFNVLGAMLMEEEHPDMCDLPMRRDKNTFPYFEDKNEGK